MPINYYEEERIFKLDTPSTSYVIAITDAENFIGHVYYGRKVSGHNITHLLRTNEPPFVPSKNNKNRLSFMDTFPMEYPTYGLGDFRTSSFKAFNTNSSETSGVCGLSYVSHSIHKGKKKINGLPATFGNNDDCTTLEIICEDKVIGAEVTLIYTVFENLDILTRHARIKNASNSNLTITRAYSASIDMDNDSYEIISLNGAWQRERHIQRKELGYGTTSYSSIRGESSHQSHPFFALVNKNTTQEYGEVYGFHLVYSGNFTCLAEVNQFDSVRASIGINSEDFEYKLKENEEFCTPEAVLTYSDKGIGKMTRTYHDLYRNHLMRGRFINTKRPVAINTWGAALFDFNTEKLISIAKDAAKLGIELFVLDDGWFGKRDDDNSSLGDWFVNEEKLPGGLEYLVTQINGLGMEFGIWFEPEMISPDSDLYRAHPDWAIKAEGRTGSLLRNQYVLDITKPEVQDYLMERFESILGSANITYVKWDMNRALTDVGEKGFVHRYVLALYNILEKFTQNFPHVLLEHCSGGGGRFDPGMLYYSPQIWCSDNTDAIDRLMIQEGTSMIYPLSTMGAHVNDCSYNDARRVVPFETRGHVALAGTFGYELDVTKIPATDKELIPEQIKMYHKYNELVFSGDYYRIASYGENKQFDCWQIVSKDKSESLVTYIQVMKDYNTHSSRIRLKGLDEKKLYRIEGTEQKFHGDILMYAGINIENLRGDFKSKLLHLVTEEGHI